MEYTDNHIAIYNDQNIPLECEIISKFKNEDTGKSYLVLTDNSLNEEGKRNMFVVSYRPDVPEEDKLRPVESIEEWESISGFLQELRKAIEENGLDLPVDDSESEAEDDIIKNTADAIVEEIKSNREKAGS